MQNYNFKCRKCSHEFLRRFSDKDFNDQQSSINGFSCYDCGFPKMAVIKTNIKIRDSFKAGWQPNIRKFCNTYAEYKAQLKLMGLVEIGYEDLPEEKEYKTKYWTPELLKKLNDAGIGFSGNELDAIGDGKIDGLY